MARQKQMGNRKGYFRNDRCPDQGAIRRSHTGKLRAIFTRHQVYFPSYGKENQSSI